MGRWPQCLCIEIILLKYCEEILQPPSCSSTYIMELKLKILETNPKSQETATFYPIFLYI